MNEPTKQAVVELVIAGLLWGFGFIATVWTLAEIGPFAVTTVRFGLAAIVLLALVSSYAPWRRHLTSDQAKLAILPGLFLSLTLIFQTWGLKYTTATKSSFITTLYVLAVPLLERHLLKRPLHRLHWLFVAVASTGTALICEFEGGSWNIGDLLTLLCAGAASMQILWFGLIAPRITSVMTFNFWQTAWALMFCLPLLFFESGPLLPRGGWAWAGMGAMIFGSTVIAFALQIRAQRVLAPSVAALLYLLESPFAALFAIGLLDERLSSTQWLGAGLILVAAGAATWLSMKPIGHIDVEPDLLDEPSSSGITQR